MGQLTRFTNEIDAADALNAAAIAAVAAVLAAATDDITANTLAKRDSAGGIRFASLIIVSDYDPSGGDPAPVIFDITNSLTDALWIDANGNITTTGAAKVATVGLSPTATPAAPTDANANLYINGGKLVCQYNQGGTTKYRYMDLTTTAAAWTYNGTIAP